MTDMQVTRGIREHGKGVKLGALGVWVGMVDAIRFPAGLPLRLDFLRFVLRYARRVDHLLAP